MWEEPGEKCQKLKSGLLQLPTTVFSLQTHWAVSNLKKKEKKEWKQNFIAFFQLCHPGSNRRLHAASPAPYIHSGIPAFPKFFYSAQFRKETEERVQRRRYLECGRWGKWLAAKKTLLRTSPHHEPSKTMTPTLHYPIWVSLMTKSRSVESAVQPFWRAFSHIRASLSLA